MRDEVAGTQVGIGESAITAARAAGRQRTHPLAALTGVASLTALGMGLAYARDASLAAQFGASAATDAFFVATILPAIAATALMSGALAPALIPIFSELVHTPGRDAWATANTILTAAAIGLAALAGAIAVGAPVLVRWLAPGFDATTAALATDLTRWAAPLLGLLGLSALGGAMANVYGSFRLPALANAAINGTAFVMLVLFGSRFGVHVAVIGALVGALAQVVAQGLALRGLGWRYRPALAFRDPAVRQVWALFVPLAAFVILAQVVPVVERVIGSTFPEGSLSLLTYAGKLYQIPGAVLTASLAIVLYPQLVRHQVSGDREKLAEAVGQGLRACVFLTMPLAIWLWFNAPALVTLLFRRGEFSAEDAAETARLLQWYVLAIVPAGLALVATRGLHAERRMNLALGAGVLSFSVYIAAAWGMARVFGLAGLPMGFVISQLFASALFGWLALGRRTLRGLLQRDTLKFAIAGAVVAVGFELARVFGAIGWSGIPPPGGVLMLALELALSLGATAVVYLGVTSAMGISIVSWRRLLRGGG